MGDPDGFAGGAGGRAPRGIDRWWPREHHAGSSPLERMVLEPRAGGRWYSICKDGSEVDVGKVVAWEPPPTGWC